MGDVLTVVKICEEDPKREKFRNEVVTPGGLYNKTFQIRNLQQMARVRYRASAFYIVSHKHTSLPLIS